MNQKTLLQQVNSKKTITIYTGEEYKLHIADENSNYEEDMFYETYKKAFNEVIKIISDNKINDDSILDMSNNIIAFCGERGQGKSSAMISFSKILENSQNKNVNQYFKEYTKLLDNKTFFAVKRIDPTELENQQSILNIIISRIFFVFKDEIEKNKSNDFREKNELLKLFQKCFRSVNLIKESKQSSSESWFGDDLELLSSLGDNAEIKKNLSKLINNFLQYIVKKDYLIIQIDDSDLNVKNAYSIAEDIRKYLMIPNVIILMATKPEQFNKAVEQEYVGSFKLLADAQQTKYPEFYKMATKYISKLIPGTRKINLPNLSLYNDNAEFDYHLKYIKKGNKLEDNEIIIDSDLQIGLLNYIYKKTGLIFISPSSYTHNIIPNTMRELVNFLSILNNLDDLEDYDSFEEMDAESIIKRINNLEVFEKYFLNSWMEENVNTSYHEYLTEWYNASWKIKNKLIIYYLSETLKVLPDYITITHQYRAVKENKLSAYKHQLENELFSYGNLLNNLSIVDSMYPLTENYKFTFAIRTLNSINLNKFILQRILSEKSGDYNKLDDIPEYIVDIFGDEINEYVPRKRENEDTGDRARARFDIRMSQTDSARFKSSLNDKEKAVFKLFFSETKKDIPRKQIQFTFDMSMPIIKILLHNSEMPLSDYFYDKEYQKLRYTCFCIISNSDVIHIIKNSLNNKTYLKNTDDNIIAYLKDFYLKISNAIKGIKNLKNTGHFDKIIDDLQKSKNVLNLIFNQNVFDNDILIRKYIIDLNNFNNTRTTNTLNIRIERTKKTLNNIKSLKLVDIQDEINDLNKLLKKRNSSNIKDLKPSTCLDYQASLNKIRMSARKKLEEIESNGNIL